ncbi:50S ribosomal protein L32e [Archaeoglobales archaeon]|nr:MAG: 50S ribosomal protein L32e [Archaeoglobales archaeon]
MAGKRGRKTKKSETKAERIEEVEDTEVKEVSETEAEKIEAEGGEEETGVEESKVEKSKVEESKVEEIEKSEEVKETEEVEVTESEVEEIKKPALDPESRRLLKVRIRQKSRKPEFKRYESHKKLRLRDKSWRRPRGMDNKMRKRIAGKKPVSVGFGTPSAIRGLHPSGFREVLVRNPFELEGIDVETEAIRIASSVGLKKRLAIEDKAKEMGIKILNPQR